MVRVCGRRKLLKMQTLEFGLKCGGLQKQTETNLRRVKSAAWLVWRGQVSRLIADAMKNDLPGKWAVMEGLRTEYKSSL